MLGTAQRVVSARSQFRFPIGFVRASNASLPRVSAPRSSLSNVGVESFRGVSQIRSLATFYTKEHEYVRTEGADVFVGISNYAQSQLGDVVYVDLPEEGEEFAKGEAFGSVESVKAASDVFLPVSGTIVEGNEEVFDNPKLVNEAAETDGWFVKIENVDEADFEGLMDTSAYATFCAEQDEH